MKFLNSIIFSLFLFANLLYGYGREVHQYIVGIKLIPIKAFGNYHL